MKKLYSIILVILLPLLASCSQDDPVNMEDNTSANTGEVYLGTHFITEFDSPQSSIQKTRAVSSISNIPEGYKLRCIVEVYDNTAKNNVIYREEKLYNSGDGPSFNFPLADGTYKCTVWADYVTANAATSTRKLSNGESAEGATDATYTHYADLFYNTGENTTLKRIKIFNTKIDDYPTQTDLQDAFYAVIDIEKTANTAFIQTIELKRPVAKITVKEKNIPEFKKLKKMTADFMINYAFQPLTGTVGSPQSVNHTKTDFTAEDGILFSNYLFVAESTSSSMESISLTFTKTDDSEIKHTIEKNQITLKRNTHSIASGNLISGGIIGGDSREDPKVGDYFFADGTWGTLTDENKDFAVGIVFAIPGKEITDSPSDYGDHTSGKNIKGYVIAKSVVNDNGLEGNKTMLYQPTWGEGNKLQTGIEQRAEGIVLFTEQNDKGSNTETWDGFTRTQTFLIAYAQMNNPEKRYPIFTLLNTYNLNNRIPTNATDWYIPSCRQINTFFTLYNNNEDFKDACTFNLEEIITAPAPYTFTSCQSSKLGLTMIKNKDSWHPSTNNTGLLRPVLTILTDDSTAPAS